jgi:integrase
VANGKSKKRIKVRAGHGYIRQNYKSSTFKAEVMIDGQRLSKSFPDVEGAQQWLEEIVRRSYKFGISLDKAKVTFGELARMFLEAKEIEGRKKTTLQDYRGTIRCCNAMWENTPVQRITPDHITRLLATLKKGGLAVTVEKTVWEYDPAAKRKVKRIQPVETVKAPYSPKHLRNIHGTIHAVLEYGVTVLSVLEYNAVDKVKAPSVPLADPKAWDDQSLQRFLKAVEGKRNETLLWVLATTGLRKGELVGLKWSDINLTTGEVTIKRRIVRLGYGNGVDISTPKSRAGMRVINLAEPALAKLRAWLF